MNKCPCDLVLRLDVKISPITSSQENPLQNVHKGKLPCIYSRVHTRDKDNFPQNK